MIKDLPYSECYAVVAAGNKVDTYHITFNIRNSEHNTFSSDFELESRFYISSGFKTPYGGSLEASAYSFTISMLENSAKVLKKAYKKIETMSKKYGYVTSATENIIRQLQAVGVKEVRISMPDQRFCGWNLVDSLSVKDDLETIRYRLNKIEEAGKELYPFTDKI